MRLKDVTCQIIVGRLLTLAILGPQIAIFLAEANLNYLHRCANTTSCVLYFYDTTKNHRRQWCSVAACGYRHQVAQFRKRQVKAKKPQLEKTAPCKDVILKGDDIDLTIFPLFLHRSSF